MSTAYSIEPTALRLRVQHFAAQLTAAPCLFGLLVLVKARLYAAT